MKRFLIGAALLALMVQTASAREQTDAPDAAILGFSPDGRYFAYEEYGFDPVSDALASVIHVIDRTTNGEAEGFPLGVVPEEIGGEFPGKAGGFQADLDKLMAAEDGPDVDALRRLVHEAAASKLAALKITPTGRRLAGVPLTQRAPAPSKDAPLDFVLWPTLPGAIPDQQYVYRLEAVGDPEPADCYGTSLPARERKVEFRLKASLTWPEPKQVAEGVTTYMLPTPADSCAMEMWISDIVAPPKVDPDAPQVVALFLSQVWQSHADDARWRAAFLPLPQPK